MSRQTTLHYPVFARVPASLSCASSTEAGCTVRQPRLMLTFYSSASAASLLMTRKAANAALGATESSQGPHSSQPSMNHPSPDRCRRPCTSPKRRDTPRHHMEAAARPQHTRLPHTRHCRYRHRCRRRQFRRPRSSRRCTNRPSLGMYRRLCSQMSQRDTSLRRTEAVVALHHRIHRPCSCHR